MKFESVKDSLKFSGENNNGGRSFSLGNVRLHSTLVLSHYRGRIYTKQCAALGRLYTTLASAAL